MAARGRGLFSLYIYLENFNDTFQKQLDRFQYYIAGMFLIEPSIKIVQDVMILQKTWLPPGGAYIPYISVLKT